MTWAKAASAPHHCQTLSLEQRFSHSDTRLGIQRDHPTQSSHPLPPLSSQWVLTAAETAPSLILSRALVPQPDFSRDRGINTLHVGNIGSLTVSSVKSNSCKEESLHPSPPFPQSILSLPFSTCHGVNKRHIYCAWLETKVELEVSAVQQCKAEMSSLKHHKHPKTEKKSIWKVFYENNGAG